MEPTPTPSVIATPARGFTLVEMMVVLAIIVIITLITLLGQSAFNRSLVLTETAYTIAFSIRQAQFMGISSRVFEGYTNAGHGVAFSSADLQKYYLFADAYPEQGGNVQPANVCPGHPANAPEQEEKPGDCIWNNEEEAVKELITTYTLNNRFSIRSFCGIEEDGDERCNDDLDTLNIVYLRPNTQSIVTGSDGNTRYGFASARITVESPDGVSKRCITVSKAGHVTVLQEGSTGCQ